MLLTVLNNLKTWDKPMEWIRNFFHKERKSYVKFCECDILHFVKMRITFDIFQKQINI